MVLNRAFFTECGTNLISVLTYVLLGCIIMWHGDKFGISRTRGFLFCQETHFPLFFCFP